MSSAYLIYSSLIIQSSHMLFNTNLPITSASYGRTCRVMNTLFSLSWHLRWEKKKKCVQLLSRAQEFSMPSRHAVVAIGEVHILSRFPWFIYLSHSFYTWHSCSTCIALDSAWTLAENAETWHTLGHSLSSETVSSSADGTGWLRLHQRPIHRHLAFSDRN